MNPTLLHLLFIDDKKRRSRRRRRRSVYMECLLNPTATKKIRSLCSFRNGGVFESEDGGDSILSGARSSISAARSSGVNGGLLLESGRRSGYSEAEPRRSGFDGEKRDSFMKVDGGFYGVNIRVFSLKESDFKGMDESRFIDLKLDFSSESKPEYLSNGKMGDALSAFGSTRHDGSNGKKKDEDDLMFKT
ncbi:hypothetical protein K1719_016514 [Acacia pycnantha]|nr:hypothetical protein K1719_016514 [Acacia pycnantha]